MKTVVILGHSHIGAVAAAIAARPLGDPAGADGLHVVLFDVWRHEGNPPYLVATADGSAGTEAFNPAIVEGALAACAGREPPLFVTLFGGNAHTVLSLMRHQRPFDVVLPEQPDLPLDPEAEIVPAGYLDSLLEGQMHRYLFMHFAFRQAVGAEARICALLPPPPIGDDTFIAARLDAFFLDNFARRDLSPPLLRHKMWRMARRLQRRICEGNAIQLVDPPAESWTPDGFLDPSCYGEDATHGGPRYGELVLQQIEALSGAPLVSWSTFAVTVP